MLVWIKLSLVTENRRLTRILSASIRTARAKGLLHPNDKLPFVRISPEIESRPRLHPHLRSELTHGAAIL